MDKDVYEPERLAALKERRREEAGGVSDDKRSLEVRFGPGSFGCHEGVHVTKLAVDLIQEQLVEHSAVLLNPYWFYCVRQAQQLLYAAYNSVGAEHLDAPMPTGERPRLYVVPNPESSHDRD